jgi:light-regulated signal transduction histidine kinase (bacteriophytochrome)
MGTDGVYRPGDRHERGPGGGWSTRLTPARITIIYLVLGVVALFVFDVVLAAVLSDPLLGQVQAVKGAVEVVLTAALIYVLTARREAQLRRMAEAVERENRELVILHRVLRHNLRNDLNVILSAVERIRESVPAASVASEFDRVEKVFRRIEKYATDARRIRAVDEGPGQRVEFDLASLLREAVTDVERPETVIVDLPDELPVRANYMLPEAVRELVGNALRCEEGDAPEVHISLAGEDDGDGTTVRIECDGCSIPRGDLEAIRRGTEDELVHANGLGLWFVSWTIDRSGGDIGFADGERGTRIHLTLPGA